MEYAVVTVSAAPVRRKPGHRFEMVNQLLFGETVKVLKSKDDLWVKTRSLHDNYEGWMTRTLLQTVDKTIVTAGNQFIAGDLLSVLSSGDNSINIPAGALLPTVTNSKMKLGEKEYDFSGSYFQKNERQASPELIMQLGSKWLNTPYLWGGRTAFGIDCSGFVQVIGRLAGFDLPRDAWQQEQAGSVVKKLKHAEAGDLAFFHNKGRIVHVGVLTGRDQIIHSSGKVRIDHIDKKSIINADTDKRGWKLFSIRRVW